MPLAFVKASSVGCAPVSSSTSMYSGQFDHLTTFSLALWSLAAWSLTLTVFEANEAARAVYDHLGYVPETLRYVKIL